MAVTAVPSPVARSSGLRAQKKERASLAVMFVLIGITLLPIWAFRYLPTMDGGAHLANADVLLHYFRPDGAIYRQYYTLVRSPIPNSMGHFALAALMLAFEPIIAEKILVTLYLILLPLALRYAIGAIRPRSKYLAILGVPISANFLLQAGFYNFCLSVVAFLFALGYWYRWRERMKISRILVLSGLTLVLFLCHLFSFTLFMLAVGVLATWFTILSFFRLPRGSRTIAVLWPGFRSRCLLTLLAFVPALVLVASFHFAARPSVTPHQTAWHSRTFWVDLLEWRVLISYTRAERFVGIGISALLGVLVIYGGVGRFGHWRPRTWDGLLAVCAGLVFLYFTYGDKASGALFIPRRLLFYILIFLILALAAQRLAKLKLFTLAGAALATIALTALHWRSMAHLNPQLEEFAQTQQKIAPGSTLLPLVFVASPLPPIPDVVTVSPFYMAAGTVMAQKHGVDLRNYEANLDYFPVRFRSELNPFTQLADPDGFDAIPQRFDIKRFETRTAGRVDYVLIWDIPQGLRQHPDTLNALRQIREGYALIYTSPSGRGQLWKRKP